MFKLDDNPCYKPGALWVTRTVISAQRELHEIDKIVKVPRGENIMLLGYTIRPNHEEHIQFLWKEQVLFALNVDVGLQFLIDPDGVNSNSKEDKT